MNTKLTPISTALVAVGRGWEGDGEHRKRAHLKVRERGAQAATNARTVPRDADVTAFLMNDDDAFHGAALNSAD